MKKPKRKRVKCATCGRVVPQGCEGCGYCGRCH